MSFEGREAPHYESSGVRKAVALAEYGSLVRNWMAHERAGGEAGAEAASEPVEYREYDSRWEQGSVPLEVSPPYDARIDRFVEYFRAERAALGADRMDRDLAVLERLAAATDESAGATPDSTERPAGDDERQTAIADEAEPGDSASSAGVVGLFGGTLPLFGALNLLVTLVVAAYGVTQKRRARSHEEDAVR